MAIPISIDAIIPVYNGASYIKDAITSVVSQTYKPKQIIIVDDGSTDGTADIVMSLAKTSTIPLNYIYKANGGHSSARNVGIAASKSDYIAFLDADDLWAEDKLERQVQVFQDTTLPSLGVVYCDLIAIDQKGNIYNAYDGYHLDLNLRGDVFEKLIYGNFIASSASGVLVRRECFEQVGVFDENLPSGEDWDMWLRLSEHYQFDFATEPLVKIRCHSNNTSKNRLLMIKGRIMVLQKLHFKRSDVTVVDELNYQIMCMIIHLLSTGRLRLLRKEVDYSTILRFLSNPLSIVRAIVKGIYKGLGKFQRRI